MFRAAFAALVGLGVLACPPATRVWAADPAEVEELIRQGVELRRDNRDPAALPLFQKAYDLDRSPRTAAQLGMVESALGYWLAAERHLTEALESPQHPWLEQHLKEMIDLLANVRSHIGELEVVGGPEGADVVVNGKSAGKLPLAQPLRVAEGSVLIALQAPGFAESSATATARGGARQRVTLQLAPLSGQTPAAPVSAPMAAAAPDVDLAGYGDRPSWIRPAAWVAASAAVAALALGTYGVLEQRKQQRLFDSYMTPGTTNQPCAILAAGRGGSPCDSIYSDAASAGHMAVAGFTGAGVLAAAAVVGFVMSPDVTGEPTARPSLPMLVLGRNHAAAGWSLRF